MQEGMYFDSRHVPSHRSLCRESPTRRKLTRIAKASAPIPRAGAWSSAFSTGRGAQSEQRRHKWGCEAGEFLNFEYLLNYFDTKLRALSIEIVFQIKSWWAGNIITRVFFPRFDPFSLLFFPSCLIIFISCFSNKTHLPHNGGSKR